MVNIGLFGKEIRIHNFLIHHIDTCTTRLLLPMFSNFIHAY